MVRPGPAQVRVVVLGQDPYPGDGQAMGLCFSVNRGVKVPQSLHVSPPPASSGRRAAALRCRGPPHVVRGWRA